jgi:ATP-dependent exoDNAse (exonuclease V) beta subunit
LLHAWLEQIEWLDQGEPDATVLRQAAKHVATTTLDIEAEMQAFRRMINIPQTQKVLSRHGYADLSPLGFSQDCQAALQNAPVTLRVLRERPFAIRDGDAMVYGIIDRLVLFCQHDHVLAADMLDFKSDALALDEATDLRDAIEAYRPQLTLYRRAIARQFGLDIHRIKARLLFLQLGEICQIED